VAESAVGVLRLGSYPNGTLPIPVRSEPKTCSPEIALPGFGYPPFEPPPPTGIPIWNSPVSCHPSRVSKSSKNAEVSPVGLADP